MRQHVHLATTPDHVQLAWARCGSGPPLVKAANWLTHLQYDLESPVWRHWIEFFAGHFEFIRYDERGCGLSDRAVEDLSAGHWLPDLECVVDSARLRAPIALLGISQGAHAAIRYAIAHPQRVSHLILYGGYVRGWARRGAAQAEHFRAVLEMVRLGWASENPAFRQTFTSRFVPGGTHEQLDWFNDLCRVSIAPQMAVRLLEARAHAEIGELLPQVRVPTLVIHGSRDGVVPVAEGRRLACEIPGAEYVELDSRNHVLLAHEPAWKEFQRAVLEFTGADASPFDATADEPLTTRERAIIPLLASGLANAEIANRLALSDKTVRNHLSSIYRKLEVSSRAEAIVRIGPGARTR